MKQLEGLRSAVWLFGDVLEWDSRAGSVRCWGQAIGTVRAIVNQQRTT